MRGRHPKEEKEPQILYASDPSNPSSTQLISESVLRTKLNRKNFHWVDASFEGDIPPKPQFNPGLALIYTGKKAGHGTLAKRVFEKGDLICHVPGQRTPTKPVKTNDAYCFYVVNYQGQPITINAEVYAGFGAFFQAGPTTEFLASINFESSKAIATANAEMVEKHKKYGTDVLVATQRIEVNQMILLDYFKNAFLSKVIIKNESPALFAKFGGEEISPEFFRIKKPVILFCNLRNQNIYSILENWLCGFGLGSY